MSVAEEMTENQKHMTHYWNSENGHVIEVDTNKTFYRQMPVRNLGRFGRRKFENLIVLARPNERIKVIYQ